MAEDVEVDRYSKVLLVFALSATDITGAAKDISMDVIDINMRPLGVRPKDDDPFWIVASWNEQDPTMLNFPINLADGFDIKTWDIGTYWWFYRPHDDPEEPVLQGDNYIEVL